MSDIVVSGVIAQALPVQSGTSQRGNQWMRASYIIEHEQGQYPKRMVFDVINAKIQELNLQVGENVTVHLNVDCREYPQGSGRFFNSIEAWKVERSQALGAQPQTQRAPQQPMQPQQRVAPQQSTFPQYAAVPQQPQQPQQPPTNDSDLPF